MDRSGTVRRTATSIVLVVAVAIGAGACGAETEVVGLPGSGIDSTTRPGLPSDAAWLEGVCESATSMNAALATLGDALKAIPESDVQTGGSPSFIQTRGQVEVGLGSVSAAATVMSGSEMSERIRTLRGVQSALRPSMQAVQETTMPVRDLSDDVSAARTPAALAAAAKSFPRPLAASDRTARELRAAIRRQAAAAKGSALTAFAKAPACGAIVRGAVK